MDESIYGQPKLYDLEHAGREPDVGFYGNLVEQWNSRRVLELGCGSGRVTIPLAMRFRARGLSITGLDLAHEMLEAARSKTRDDHESPPAPIDWVEGDLRTWRAPSPFDLILAPCGTLSHLLSLEDQLATWRTAYRNLQPGGRFVAAVGTADLAAFAESMQHPPRAVLELDRDKANDENSPTASKRLLRCKAVLYDAVEQRGSVHFFYDQFKEGEPATRQIADYEHHVYYPRELQLLFLASGFHIESVLGDYSTQPLSQTSRSMVVIGLKPES